MTKISNIAYVGINSSYSHSMLAFGKLQAWCENKNITANWHEFSRTTKDYENGLVNDILATDTQVVFATCYLFNVDVVVKVLAMIKAINPDIVTVVGGPEFLGNNETFLSRYSFIDYCIRGDESSVDDFIIQLEHKEGANDLISTKGVCYLDNERKLIDNGCALFDGDADELPSLYELGLFPTNKAFIQYETSRGCPNQCSFCTSSLSSNRLLQHSLERVRSDLQFIRKANICEIRLLDRTFNANKKRTVALLKMFIEEFSEMRFHLEIYPALIDDEICEVLATAKPEQLHVEVGVQSLDMNILHACKRNFKVEKTVAGIEKLVAVDKFEIHGDLLSGLPEQHLSDIFSDVYGLMKLKIAEIQLEVLKVLAGTPIAENLPKGHCFNLLTPYQVLKTEYLSVKDLAMADDLSKVLDSFYNNHKIQRCFVEIMQISSQMLLKFCIFYRQYNCGMQKLALNKRFDVLQKFLESLENCPKRKFYRELIKFFWLVLALPPENYGYKVMKNESALFNNSSNFTSDNEAVKVQSKLLENKYCEIFCEKVAKNERPSRFCLAKLDYNFMPLLKNYDVENVLESENYYIFRYLHGQRLYSITNVKNK